MEDLQKVFDSSDFLFITGVGYEGRTRQINLSRLIMPELEDICQCDEACSNGNFELVQSFVCIDQCHSNNGCFSTACCNGHLQIVKFFVDKGVNNYDEGLFQSHINCHVDIVEFLISNQKGLFERSSEPNFMDNFSEKQVNELLEMGVCIQSFSDNPYCKELLKEIQIFKVQTLKGLDHVLIPDLSKMIADYSLN